MSDNPLEQPYLDLLAEVLEVGEDREDRTGTGTRGVFGRMLRFDLGVGFPAVTTKKLQWRSVVGELAWFLRGETNVAGLHAQGLHFWDAWADAEGELGPVYGRQWRAWETADGRHVDQIAEVIERIRKDPSSRRHIVSAWNVGQLQQMRLPPCHLLFQFHVGRGRLSCQLYQRSADLFLGVPFNIASYALLTHLVAERCGLEVGEFVHVLGDAHIYRDHFEQVREQLGRAPFPPPRLELTAPERLEALEVSHARLVDYRHHPALRAPISV